MGGSKIKQILSVGHRKVAQVAQRSPRRTAIPAPDPGRGRRILRAVERDAQRITIDADNPEFGPSAWSLARLHHGSWFIFQKVCWGNAVLVNQDNIGATLSHSGPPTTELAN
jgi:hypothetical protein